MVAVPQSDGVWNGVRVGRPRSIIEGQPWSRCWDDVSLKDSSVCVVDVAGRIVREARLQASRKHCLPGFAALAWR